MRFLIVVATALLAPAGASAQAPTMSAAQCQEGQQAMNQAVAAAQQAQNSRTELSMQAQVAQQQYAMALQFNPEFAPGSPMALRFPGNVVEVKYQKLQDLQKQLDAANQTIQLFPLQVQEIQAKYGGCNLTTPPLP